MNLAGCLNGTKTSYVSKAHGKLDFSCHNPFSKMHVSCLGELGFCIFLVTLTGELNLGACASHRHDPMQSFLKATLCNLS